MRKRKGSFRILFDLIIPVCILVCIGIILIINQRGYQSPGAGGFEEHYLDESEWEKVRTDHTASANHAGDSGKTLLIFGGNDSASVQIKNEFSFVLHSMGVFCAEYNAPVRESGAAGSFSADPAALYSEYTDIILCESALSSSGIKPMPLADWVKEGGHLIIAGGLDADELVNGWDALLGIAARKTPLAVHADSVKFATSFLAGAKGMEFSDEVISCDVVNVTLDKKCLVHAATTDEYTVPLLWELSFGKGEVLVLNADLIDGKSDRGMISACYCKMQDAFAYPVINAAVYCIDDFPSVAPAGYDRNILSQYGYTINDFYANVWWPAMHQLSQEYGIPYSAFLIQCYEDDVNGPFDNMDSQPSAAYYARLLLEDGCEIGLHGYNHQPLVLDGYDFDEKNSGYITWKSTDKMVEATRAAINYAKTLSQEIEIRAYVAPSNVISSDSVEALIDNIPDLRVFAGIYIGTPDQMVQEFEALDKGVVYVPRLTADMQMEDSEWWLQINELNYHYYESNFIHPDDILDEDRSDGGDFASMLTGYEKMVEWNINHGLRSRTISDAAGAVQRYCNLSLTQEMMKNGIRIHIEGLIDEAYLLLRLNKHKPSNMTGGSYSSVDEDCYLLTIDSSDVIVEWED